MIAADRHHSHSEKFSRQIFVGFFFCYEKIRHIVYVTKKLINESGILYDKLN